MQDSNARYSCQVKLPGFGEEAQTKLEQAKVLIVGAGGLGCPAAQYLAGAGVGVLGIADHDVISISNLHRQILYNENEAGQKKAVVAAHKLQLQNPALNIVAYDIKVTSANAGELVRDHDVIVDCTDNFETRYLLNDACVLSGKPLVYGAIYQYEGQVAVWNMPNEDGTRTPNYRDVFADVNNEAVPDCSTGGVLPTLAGIIGCMQANEVIKIITGVGDVLSGKLLIWDAQAMQQRVIDIGRQTNTEILTLPATVFNDTLSAMDLKAAMHTGACLLVDVRTAEEHEEYNIGGINIPLSELIYQEESLFTGKQVVCYCLTGSRSKKAVERIKQQYPEVNVLSLEGGIQYWQED